MSTQQNKAAGQNTQQVTAKDSAPPTQPTQDQQPAAATTQTPQEAQAQPAQTPAEPQAQPKAQPQSHAAFATTYKPVAKQLPANLDMTPTEIRCLGPLSPDGVNVYAEGDIIEVPKYVADMFCKPIEGSYAFSGVRYQADGDVKKFKHYRAEIVK